MEAPADDRADAAGHREPAHRHPRPLHRPARGRARVGPPSTFDAERVFEACAATGTAVEINSRPERLDPPEPLLELALSLGCVVHDRHRRPCPGPARMAAHRLRAGGPVRGPGGTGHEHPAARSLLGLDGRPRRLKPGAGGLPADNRAVGQAGRSERRMVRAVCLLPPKPMMTATVAPPGSRTRSTS